VASDGDGSFVRTGEAEGFALDSAAEDEPPVALRLALEAARAAGRLPQRLVLRAASGAALPKRRGWGAVLELPVEPGAAWRWSQARSRPRFELLQGEFAPRGTGGAWREALVRPALLAAALVALDERRHRRGLGVQVGRARPPAGGDARALSAELSAKAPCWSIRPCR
jgi:hypothetical protein